MKIKIAVLLSCFILTSCDDENVIALPDKWKCLNPIYSGAICPMNYIYKDVCETQKLSDFIINCAKAANPMSDEEGEDLVQECGKRGEKLYCNRTFYMTNSIQKTI